MFDNIQADSDAVKQQGTDLAAGILAQLKSFDPIDIYKASCSVKCAEVLARSFESPEYPTIVEFVANFIETTMGAVKGNNGNSVQGLQVLEVIKANAPIEEAPTAEQFAVRSYLFDSLILESAKKLGKEKEVKDSLDTLQRELFLHLLKSSTGVTIPGSEQIN